MKRLLWIVLPALILVGLIYLNRALADWHYIDSGATGSLLAAATFDGDATSPFNQAWEQYAGRLESRIEGGELRLTIGDSNRGSYSLTYAHYADFDVRTQGRALEGPVNNGYGIIFRLQDRSNYYLFEVSSDGYYSVQRVLNGHSQFLSAWILTTTPTPLPELNGAVVHPGLNETNTLRVVAHGDQFTFYINGVLAPLCLANDPTKDSIFYEIYDTPEQRCVQGHMSDTLTDSAILNGQLGVAAQSFDFGDTDRGVVVEFDDMLIFGA